MSVVIPWNPQESPEQLRRALDVAPLGQHTRQRLKHARVRVQLYQRLLEQGLSGGGALAAEEQLGGAKVPLASTLRVVLE